MTIAARIDGAALQGASELPGLGQHKFGVEHTAHFNGHAEIVTIPDAHLLFSGTFGRAGNDLILSDSGQKFVVQDYFKTENRPYLASREGATLSPDIVSALTGHTTYAQAAGGAATVSTIGHVLKLSGSASVVRNGVTVELNVGDAVMKGDVVQTGSDSSIGITFIDGSAFGMAANARMVLNDMVYDPNGSSNSSLISLVQGTITFVAGQTAKNGHMRVETPVATMGIRGTAVLVEISADDGPTKFSVLVEPDGHTGSYNLYEKGTDRLIGTVSQAGQVTFVSPNGSTGEQALTLAAQQQQKALIEQVFKLYFPNYNPDTTNPKSNKNGGIGSSDNNLAELHFNAAPSGTISLITVTVKIPHTDEFGNTTYSQRIYVNTHAIFGTTPAETGQAFAPTNYVLNIADHVNITDPDIGAFPFFDVATPFVKNTLNVTVASSSISGLQDAFLLGHLATIDQQTGQVTFNRQAFNFLDDGETVVFKVAFDSSSGPDTAHLNLLLTITGANDQPVFDAAPVTVAVHEIGALPNPSPLPDTPPPTGGNGVLEQTVTLKFTDADFTETGVNYQAEVLSVSAGVTPPEGTPATSSLFNYFNLLSSGAVTKGVNSITPATTVLELVSGEVTGTFSAPDKDFDYLAEDQSVTLTYKVGLTDLNDPTATQFTKTFTVTITGSNDTPTILSGGDISGTVIESDPANLVTVASVANLHVTGTLDFTDVDLIDTHIAISPTATNSVAWAKFGGGNGGTIPPATLTALASALTASLASDSTHAQTGQLSWDFKLPDSLADFLAEGETLTVTYSVTVQDQATHPLSATQPITITITGTNDKPVAVADTDIGHVVEAGNFPNDTAFAGTPTTTGNVLSNDTDLDINDTHFVAGVIAGASTAALTGGVATAALGGTSVLGTYGTLTINKDGSWSYTLDNNNTATNALAQDAPADDVFSYTVSDNHGGTSTTTLTVGITGTNDAPTANMAPLALTDVNLGPPVVEKGVGANSSPFDGVDTASGNVLTNDSDVDQPDTKMVQGVAHGTLTGVLTENVGDVIQGTYGTLTLAANGIWHYTLDNDLVTTQSLAGSETASDVFTYTMHDSGNATSTATLTITITGTNDAPVLAAGTALTTVTEDDVTNFGQLVSSFATGITDVDAGALKGIAITDFTSSHGHWEYSTNNGTDWLAFEASYSATSALLLASSDKVKFVPDALNGGTDTLTYVAWDQTLGTHGVATDISAGDHAGAVSVDSDTVSLTVTEVNDAPIAADNLLTTLEDTAHIFTAAEFGFSDTDGNQFSAVQIGTLPGSAAGTLTLDGHPVLSGDLITAADITDGHLVFTPAADVNGAAAASFTFQVKDDGGTLNSGVDLSASHTITFDVTPVDDAPVISTAGVQVVNHSNGTTTISGLSFTDVDSAADQFTITGTTPDGHGTITPASGTGTFTEANTALTTTGVLYTPTDTSTTGKVVLTVADADHVTDTVNFIFKQAGSAGVTLASTTDKDVLIGGQGADNFVFTANSNKDTVVAFQTGIDKIDLTALNITEANWFANHTETVSGGTLVHLDTQTSGFGGPTDHDTILIKAAVAATDFILHPAGS